MPRSVILGLYTQPTNSLVVPPPLESDGTYTMLINPPAFLPGQINVRLLPLRPTARQLFVQHGVTVVLLVLTPPNILLTIHDRTSGPRLPSPLLVVCYLLGPAEPILQLSRHRVILNVLCEPPNARTLLEHPGLYTVS